jgi:hypothetical protein
MVKAPAVPDSREVTFTVRPCSFCRERAECASINYGDTGICARCVRKVADAFEHVGRGEAPAAGKLPSEEIAKELEKFGSDWWTAHRAVVELLDRRLGRGGAT